MSRHRIVRHVLVVDDDPIIRDMMVDILSFEDYAVCTARNGNEALEVLRGSQDYLVFLDLMMPGLSGEGVCEILHADATLRDRHVIVLMSAKEKAAEGLALEVDALLPKPFSLDEVLEVLEPYKG
jgi:CheY-like chemotaxis protein